MTPTDPDRNTQKLRRFSLGVSVALAVLCNAVFLLGLWGSGLNLDTLIKTPELFDPAKDVCLRLGWHRVAGIEDPIRLCNEWIQLSDPSGETHKLRQETKVVKGADGRLYFDHGARADYRLALYGAFVAAVIAAGLLVKRYLIARYRVRLEMTGGQA